MTLPKMKPTPMPGPMVRRPAPMPAIALPALRPYSLGIGRLGDLRDDGQVHCDCSF
jgi:hypothetical protein